MADIKDIVLKVNHLNVLYVEDEIEVRGESERFIRHFFPNLVVATNGQEAWDIFQEKDFDMVITDLKMPIMNGNDLMKKIKQVSPSTVTVLMSGISMEIDEEIAADFKLSKPVNINQFIDFLDAFIKTHL